MAATVRTRSHTQGYTTEDITEYIEQFATSWIPMSQVTEGTKHSHSSVWWVVRKLKDQGLVETNKTKYGTPLQVRWIGHKRMASDNGHSSYDLRERVAVLEEKYRGMLAQLYILMRVMGLQ